VCAEFSQSRPVTVSCLSIGFLKPEDRLPVPVTPVRLAVYATHFSGDTPEKITQSPNHRKATPGGAISSGRWSERVLAVFVLYLIYTGLF
jgi:hypothetical protein